MVLACKSKPDARANRINPNRAAEVCNVYGGAGIVQLDGGVEDEGRKMRHCFLWLFKAIMVARGALPHLTCIPLAWLRPQFRAQVPSVQSRHSRDQARVDRVGHLPNRGGRCPALYLSAAQQHPQGCPFSTLGHPVSHTVRSWTCRPI